MIVLIVAFFALCVGFLLIAFISRTAPAAAGLDQAGAGPEAWLGRLRPDELQKLLSLLFAEMKFEIESSSLRAGDVDLFAVNPTPITGARIYVRGVAHPPLGRVGEEEIRIALETARAEMAGKAIVVTPGGFTPEARASASGTPVDLLDGAALLGLVKKHLPQVAAEKHL
ncbi:MAG: restriction endonuclease [Deltaproteobacteria bacterium]